MHLPCQATPRILKGLKLRCRLGKVSTDQTIWKPRTPHRLDWQDPQLNLLRIEMADSPTLLASRPVLLCGKDNNYSSRLYCA